MWKGSYTRSFDHLTALHIILEETAFCHVYISPQHSRVSYLGMRRFVHRKCGDEKAVCTESVIMKRLCAQKVWLQKGLFTESVITKRLVHRKCDYKKAVCTESVISCHPAGRPVGHSLSDCLLFWLLKSWEVHSTMGNILVHLTVGMMW